LARQAAPRAALLGVSIDPVLPEDHVTVWADPGRLQQVLSNLFDNALVHTPSGGRVTISARPDGRFIVIAVTDTGPGIPPEHLPHVFDRFYRADPSRSRATGGVGLGLAIARQLVEASGGAITVDSAPGAGTTFSVRWPSAFTASS
jgi:two-component system sensor histidine kinase BaeS